MGNVKLKSPNTAEEIEAFYEAELAESGVDLEEFRDQISSSLLQQKAQLAVLSFINQLRSKADIQILMIS